MIKQCQWTQHKKTSTRVDTPFMTMYSCCSNKIHSVVTVEGVHDCFIVLMHNETIMCTKHSDYKI